MAQIRIGTMPAKDPDEKKDYSLDWSKELKEKDGDKITASSWVVTGAGLTQSASPAPSFDDQTTTVWFEAGTVGTDYVITNRITTNAGRTHEASFVLPLRNAGA